MSSIESYYDHLAPYYKFMLEDWETSVNRQASTLDGIICEFFGPHVRNILDAACGIGTQSIGLAQLGYAIKASDISQPAVAEARAEAFRRGLHIDFGIADMRQLTRIYQQPFDLVIACDNAIPHLLSNSEIQLAFDQFHQCTVPGGGCIISVRDYSSIERVGRILYSRPTHKTPDGCVIAFDLWEFDQDFYDFTTYIVEDKGQPIATTHVIRGGRYYCVTIATLEDLLRQAGFQKITTLKDRFYQPLIIGIKG